MKRWIRAILLGACSLDALVGGACRDEPSASSARPEAAATGTDSAPNSIPPSAATPDPTSLRLPSSVPPAELARAIVLRVTKAGVYAGEEKIESGDHSRVERLEGVIAFLRARRDERKEADPSRPFDGVVILDVDDDTPAVLVKCTFQSAAYAGFQNVGFAPKHHE